MCICDRNPRVSEYDLKRDNKNTRKPKAAQITVFPFSVWIQ